MQVWIANRGYLRICSPANIEVREKENIKIIKIEG
jgi:hypothetical protein